MYVCAYVHLPACGAAKTRAEALRVIACDVPRSICQPPAYIRKRAHHQRNIKQVRSTLAALLVRQLPVCCAFVCVEDFGLFRSERVLSSLKSQENGKWGCAIRNLT